METATVETCPPFLTPRESRTLGRTQIYGSPSASLLCVYSGIHTEVKPKGSKPTLANTLHKVRLVNFVFEYEAFSQGEPQCIDFLVGGKFAHLGQRLLREAQGVGLLLYWYPWQTELAPIYRPMLLRHRRTSSGGA